MTKSSLIPVFDAGFIPSADGKRRMESGAQIKALIKIWHSAGFVEHVKEGGGLWYGFDHPTFDRMRAQALRADDKRQAGRSLLRHSLLSAPRAGVLPPLAEAVAADRGGSTSSHVCATITCGDSCPGVYPS